MDKILELLIEDFHKQKPSAEYRLVLNRTCNLESDFIDSLNSKQKAKYLELEPLCNELSVIELHEFAEFLFEYLSK